MSQYSGIITRAKFTCGLVVQPVQHVQTVGTNTIGKLPLKLVRVKVVGVRGVQVQEVCCPGVSLDYKYPGVGKQLVDKSLNPLSRSLKVAVAFVSYVLSSF